MDPTKPILTLGDNNGGCFYRDVVVKPIEKVSFEDRYQQMEYERNFYKEEYQRLYQVYQEQKLRLQDCDQLRSYVSQLEAKVNRMEGQNRGGGANPDELRVLREKNQRLSETILNKNYELEDAYRRIQGTSKTFTQAPGFNRKVLASVDKLEDGVKEAIFSNFELLKNNTIGELKNLIRNPIVQTTTYAPQVSGSYLGSGLTTTPMRPGNQSPTLPRY